jgi:hypothetical protein
MRGRTTKVAWLLGFLSTASLSLYAKTGSLTQEAPQTIAARTRSMQHMTGLLALHWDVRAGKLYLEIPHLHQDLLYFDSMAQGTGSNDLGLDRGRLGSSARGSRSLRRPG